MYGTELMVVYVELSVKVDTLITVSVTKLVVVRVWSTVIVVGLTFVVFKSSQQYIPSGSWKRLQVRILERVCRWMDIWGKGLLVYPPREASTDVSSKPLLISWYPSQRRWVRSCQGDSSKCEGRNLGARRGVGACGGNVPCRWRASWWSLSRYRLSQRCGSPCALAWWYDHE